MNQIAITKNDIFKIIVLLMFAYLLYELTITFDEIVASFDSIANNLDELKMELIGIQTKLIKLGYLELLNLLP